MAALGEKGERDGGGSWGNRFGKLQETAENNLQRALVDFKNSAKVWGKKQTKSLLQPGLCKANGKG